MTRLFARTLALLLTLTGIAQAAAPYDPATARYPDAGSPAPRGGAILAGPIAAATLYGVDVSVDSLLVINTTTAHGTMIGPVGTPIVGDLAYDPQTGILYATDTLTGNLLTINPADGTTHVIGNTGLTLLHGLAFDLSTGGLYTTDEGSNLYAVNKSTGASTLVGPTGFPHIGALSFDPTTGILYGAYAYSDFTGFLIRIEKANGQGTFVANTHRINGMSFDANGVLYAADNGLFVRTGSSLYLVDKTTGAWGLIGAIGADNVLGIAFSLPGVVPVMRVSWGAVKAGYRFGQASKDKGMLEESDHGNRRE